MFATPSSLRNSRGELSLDDLVVVRSRSCRVELGTYSSNVHGLIILPRAAKIGAILACIATTCRETTGSDTIATVNYHSSFRLPWCPIDAFAPHIAIHNQPPRRRPLGEAPLAQQHPLHRIRINRIPPRRQRVTRAANTRRTTQQSNYGQTFLHISSSMQV